MVDQHQVSLALNGISTLTILREILKEMAKNMTCPESHGLEKGPDCGACIVCIARSLFIEDEEGY